MRNRSSRVRTPNSVGNYSKWPILAQNGRIVTLNSTVFNRLDWKFHRISRKEFCVQGYLIWPHPTSLFEMRATIRKKSKIFKIALAPRGSLRSTSDHLSWTQGQKLGKQSRDSPPSKSDFREGGQKWPKFFPIGTKVGIWGKSGPLSPNLESVLRLKNRIFEYSSRMSDFELVRWLKLISRAWDVDFRIQHIG